MLLWHNSINEYSYFYDPWLPTATSSSRIPLLDETFKQELGLGQPRKPLIPLALAKYIISQF